MKGPDPRRQFVPALEFPAADSPVVVVPERLRAAGKLAIEERKYAEARQAYEKIVVNYPDTGWAKMAQV